MRSQLPSRLLAASALVASCIALAGAVPQSTSVLFIGNSFTYGHGSAVRFYRSNTVTDLNNEGIGGVPALFESFTSQAGLDYDVSLETRGGAGFEFHLENKQDALVSNAWNKVVLQGQSMLDNAKPGDPAKIVATAKQIADVLRKRNAAVELYLMATWSRADQTYPEKGAWFGKPIEAMARDVRAGYEKAAAAAEIKTIIPVGEAWTRAMRDGIADSNPYDGIEAGKLDLWAADHYHASAAGSYLEALVAFGALTGREPRALGRFECSAFELGLSPVQAEALQQVAFDQLAASGLSLAPGTSARKQAASCAPAPVAAATAGR